MEDPKFIKDIQSILANQCGEYLIIAYHDDVTYRIMSSHASAYGMCEMIKQEIEDDWCMERQDSNCEEEE